MNCNAAFNNNYFWVTTGSLLSTKFSLANLRCTEVQEAESMASVPLQKKNSSHLLDILHHTQRISRFTNGEIQPRGWPFPSHTTSLRYSDSDYEVIHMPIWPTKLLPAITSARLVVVASPTAARDDRCALSNYQTDQL